MASHQISNANYRYIESTILEGDYLYALGHFKTHRAGSIKEQAQYTMSQILMDWKKDYPSLVARFDSNNDGKIDMKEWEIARKNAYNEALKEVRNNHSSEGLHLMVAPPAPLPFIISGKDPKQLCKIYRYYAGFSIFGLASCLFAISKLAL